MLVQKLQMPVSRVRQFLFAGNRGRLGLLTAADDGFLTAESGEQSDGPWARYGPRAPTPSTLPDKVFKHWDPLNIKSTGNSKNIGLHYPFGSNV